MNWKPIKKDLYKWSFVSNKFPLWTCPKCENGNLSVDKGSVRIIESVTSIKNKSHEDWDPSWICGSFSGALKCVNSDCEESIQIFGEMSVSFAQRIEKDENGLEYRGTDLNIIQEDLLPLAFFPTLKIFKIHSDVPAAITTAIIETFKLYWIDTEACCNKIRTVVELILELELPDEKKTYIQDGEEKKYKLNTRLKSFKDIKPSEADSLMAIKWIGNEGSHNLNTLTKDDVLDAYDMLNYVTTMLYDKDPKKELRELQEKGKMINKTSKPISHLIREENDKNFNGIIIESSQIIIDEF